MLDSDFFYLPLWSVSKFWTPHFLSISVPREKDKDILHKSVDSGGPGLVVTFVSTNPQMASKTVP